MMRAGLARFAADRGGAVAIMFALVLVPLLAAIGAAMDYSRVGRTRTELQAATDMAALTAGKAALDESRRDLSNTARGAFDSVFRPADGTAVTGFKVRQTANRLDITVGARVPTVFARFIGVGAVDLEASAGVPLGVSSLEVALVLDNTGSMGQLGKMAALKEAAKNLIDTLQRAPNVAISIVPFNTQVNVGDANRSAAWLRYTPGSPEPRLAVTPAAWTGCVADRDQPEDARDTLPAASRQETLFPAAQCQYAGLLPIVPLSGDFSALKTQIDAMAPTGNTNTTIGLAWGMNTLTPGAPLSGSAKAPSAYLQRSIIFLTDGMNTQNRFTSDPAQIDPRTDRLCNVIKSDKIRLYTIRVIDGNEQLLRNCASDPSMYYSVNQASELKSVFDKIAAELVTLRLSY